MACSDGRDAAELAAHRKAKTADLEVLAGSQPGSDVVQQLEAELAAMELEQVS